jgi:hypothetical protein
MSAYYTEVVILDKDLKSGLVKKKYYNGNTEYWVYRKKEGKIYLPDGKKSILQDRKESYLFCIVICEDSNYVVKKNDEGKLIKGFKVTGKSINKYLKNTNRHVD